MMRKLFLSLAVLLWTASIYSQDLSSLGGPLLGFSGNISVGTSFYNAFGQENRRSPLSYYITGSPTVSIYGFDIPLSFSYRDQQGAVSNPFNRISINPSYKWVSISAGKFTKTLSPYTLSGQVITGGAIDLTPGKFRFSAVAGTMENAFLNLDTIVNGLELLPNYKRQAYGAKIGLGGSKNYFDFIVFKAKDDIESITQDTRETIPSKPEDNLVTGTSFKISPIKWISLKGEVSASLHTSNQETSDFFSADQIDRLNEQVGSLILFNYTTRLQFAYDGSVDFKFKSIGLGAQYRRVDPYYKSLGALYFQEDYENYLFKFRLNLLKNKIRLNSQLGIQQNNLTGLRSNTNFRQIGSLSLTISPSRDFVVSTRYSNFQTERRPGLISVNDSFRVARANTSFSFSPRVSFGPKDLRSSITASFFFQMLEDLIEENMGEGDFNNYSANLGYSIKLVPRKMSFSVSVVGNRNSVNDITRNRIGLNSRVVKTLLEDKLTVNVGFGSFLNFQDQTQEGVSLSTRSGIKYKFSKSTSASFNLNHIYRSGDTGFQELRGMLRAMYILPKFQTKSKINNQKPSKTNL